MVSVTAQQSITEEVIHDDLRRFWKMEEPTTISCLTSHDLSCDQHFLSTHKRLPSGRYMVRLPFRNGSPRDIDNSLTRAKLVLKGVQARLLKDSSLYNEYKEFLTEYEQLGHMERVQEFSDSDTPQTVYLPRHPIVKDSSSTTRVRVVFHASSLTSNNTSLNSHLYIGPKILTNLVSIILRWRFHRLVFVADVEKMFRQILVDPHDRKYQRIVCYFTKQRLELWELNTVTYGTACAPYIAIRVIKQLVIDEGSDFGADEMEAARELKTQVIQLFTRGCFRLRKWASNNELLLSDCPSGTHERAFEFHIDEESKLKVLDVQWYPTSDVFQFKIEYRSMEFPTKRLILSVMAIR